MLSIQIPKNTSIELNLKVKSTLITGGLRNIGFSMANVGALPRATVVRLDEPSRRKGCDLKVRYLINLTFEHYARMAK